MTIIGIDPGITGGIAILDEHSAECEELLHINGDLCVSNLRSTLMRVKPDIVMVEEVNPMPKQAVQSIRTSCTNYGQILGVVRTLQIPLRTVRPSTWTKALFGKGQLDGKNTARAYVERVYPLFEYQHFNKAIREGVIDALCIAEYCRRLEGKEAKQC